MRDEDVTRIGTRAAALLVVLLPAIGSCQSFVPSDPGIRPLPVGTLRLPPGFAAGVFSADVPGARSLALGAKGTVFVGTRGEGVVYALRDENGDGRAERVVRIARGLDTPNGVAFRDGALYVAEISRILRYDGIEDRLDAPPAPVVVHEGLPRDRHHGWKFIAFGPDGALYVPVGAPCNVCEPDPVYAAIHRLRPDGSGLEAVARGVRNTVGFDWHPTTRELWFTDNGRDGMGDDRPSCELNRAPAGGLHFGFPYVHGAGLRDPEHGRKRDPSEFTRPAAELGAHVAPLGMRFYAGEMFPKKYRGAIFVAEHGSWNRSRAVGYRVVAAFLAEDGRSVTGAATFAEGWLSEDGRTAWGRPVDVLVMPDGALLVSDDRAGAVYRVAWEPR
jgi:glucose/arabinose dehydrogenase